jgi:hypothetical protein
MPWRYLPNSQDDLWVRDRMATDPTEVVAAKRLSFKESAS